MKLLTKANSNSKTSKNAKFDKYLSTIMHLAPSNLSGFNVCEAASNGCKAACLNTAGRGQMKMVQDARIKKTRLFILETDAFLQQLANELNNFQNAAFKSNKIPVVRLNGTSDVKWEDYHIQLSWGKVNIFELFPDIQFYDYTKIPYRAVHWGLGNLFPDNYHLTFSRSEVNEKSCRYVLKNGGNVAIVYKNGLPATDLGGYKVIDGDDHDLRFLDPKNVIVGLKAKGKAKKDTTGFVKEVI